MTGEGIAATFSLKMSPNPPIAPPKSRVVRTVRILTELAVTLFVVVLFIVPRGITVPWGYYLVLFAPVILVDVSALAVFAYCRLRRLSVSPVYAVICIAVIAGVYYLTWFELRLRWHELRI